MSEIGQYTMMKKRDYAKQINYTISEISQIYHEFSALYGLSDSVSEILYILEVEGGTCNQSLLNKNTMISRKTISSALSGMARNGYIHMEKKNGRENTISLTDQGKEYLNATEANITKAEMHVYAKWDEKELALYLQMNQRFLKEMKEELEVKKCENRIK